MQTYDSQKFEIDRYCSENGLKVDKWVLESVSGEEVRAMRENGVPLTHIAEILGIHRNTLRKYIMEDSSREHPDGDVF